MVVGIDPSFSNTGVSIYHEGKFYFISIPAESKGIYAIDCCLKQADLLAKSVIRAIKSVGTPTLIIQEYPVMATRPGGVLSVLMTCLWKQIKHEFPHTTYYMVPSMAVKSFTKCNTKPALVKFVENHSGHKGINHDEATAYILSLIGIRIHKKQYKNSYYSL